MTATKRQKAMHTGGGGHDGAVIRGHVNPYLVETGDGSFKTPTKHDLQGMHDQAVKDGRTKDAHLLSKHLEDVHGGGGFHGS